MPGEERPDDPVGVFIAAVRANRPASVLALDFDGTLAEIVEDPAVAVPLPGAVAAVERAASRWGEVAVVSGRPLRFLEGHLPAPEVTLVGLYGLEIRRAGSVSEHQDAAAWRAAVGRAVELARESSLERVGIESKGASLTLHYRTARDQALAVEDVARQIAAATGLLVRPAKLSIELHPPTSVDKGTAMADLASRHPGPVGFVGDDLGDLPAFGVLSGLRSTGRITLAAAVIGAETPAGVTAAADTVLDGPAGVLDLLDRLDQ